MRSHHPLTHSDLLFLLSSLNSPWPCFTFSRTDGIVAGGGVGDGEVSSIIGWMKPSLDPCNKKFSFCEFLQSWRTAILHFFKISATLLRKLVPGFGACCPARTSLSDCLLTNNCVVPLLRLAGCSAIFCIFGICFLLILFHRGVSWIHTDSWFLSK